jgi:hypothetical protein
MRPLLAPLLAALMLLFAFTGLFTAAYHDPDPNEIPVAVVGALSGAFWSLAGVSALVAFGVAAAVHGLGRAFGLVGVALDRLATHHPRLAIGLSRTPAASAAA